MFRRERERESKELIYTANNVTVLTDERPKVIKDHVAAAGVL